MTPALKKMSKKLGKIIKGIGGFYYVKTADQVVQTRGRGIFRKEGITPTVGDQVEYTILEDGDGVIDRILPRKNEFPRPPIANVDAVVIVFAASRPKPNFDLIDKFLVMAESKGVQAILCMNKCDLISDKKADEILRRYQGVYPSVRLCATTGEGIEDLRKLTTGRNTAFAGPSGVGKSTITNLLIPDACMDTSDVSHKTNRGRHTTRHVEIFELPEGGSIYDTPGFTSFDISDVEAEELDQYYPDILKYKQQCRFDDCRHIREPECAVRHALEEGELEPLRYQSYVRLFEELKDKRRKY